MKKAILICAFITTLVFVGNVKGQQNIFEAVRSDSLNSIKVLIDNNPKLVNDRDEQLRTPLHIAVLVNDLNIVKYLLDNGALVNEGDNIKNTPLWYVAWRTGNLEVAKILVAKGADINSSNRWNNSKKCLKKFNEIIYYL